MLWAISTALGVGIIFAPVSMSNINYVYSPLQAALYNSLSPWLWGSFLFWGAIAVNSGNAGKKSKIKIVVNFLSLIFACSLGWFGTFLCWKPFQIFSKIAYAFYLTQFPIFFFNIGQRRFAERFKPHLLVCISIHFL